MPIEHVEVLVEEPSMEVFLRALLPQLLADKASFEVYPSQCKQDLLDNLPDRLRAYASWLPNTYRIVVVVDRDADDCKMLKNRLEDMAKQAGLVSRESSMARDWQIVNRLAIEELEAWFVGDMNAVRKAYPRIRTKVENKKGYRDPDAILGGTWEALERVLNRAGYFRGGLRKIEAARAIATHMDPTQNRSRSFRVFRDAIVEMAEDD